MPILELTTKISVILLLKLVLIVRPLCPAEQIDTSVNYAANGDFQVPNLNGGWRFTTTQLDGWSSTKIEQGRGSIYNPAWGSGTQVIEMDTNINQMYNQTLILPESKFSFKISYAARAGPPLTTSGLRIWWNGQIIRNIPTSLDYNVHTETFILQANAGNNYLVLEGAGTSDGVGMTCDNIIFNRMESFNRVEVDGECLCDIGYFDDFMHYSCQPCASIDPRCSQCSYGSIQNNSTNSTNSSDSSNSSNYTNSSNSSDSSNSSNSFNFTNSSNSSNSSNTSNPSISPQLFTCLACQQGYYNQGGACAPCSQISPGCYNCSMDGLDCYNCNQTENYFSHMLGGGRSSCQLCNLEGCLMCSTSTSCSVCDTANQYNLDAASGQCVNCLSCACRTGGKIQDIGVPKLEYSEEQCQSYQHLQNLGIFIGVASYIIMFLSLLSVKIVGLELFGVLQLAFFNLADNSYINLYLSPLLSWKYLNGFNLALSTAQPSIPQNVQAIKYNGSFIANINIMFLLLIVEFVVALTLVILARKKPILERISKFLFHEVFLTLFLFSSFNIAFSVGLHFKYSTQENTENYGLSTFAAVLGVLFYLIILVVIQAADENQFGEFKNKFKKDSVNQMYIFVSVLYRMALGVYMAVGNEQTYGTLLILSFSFLYIMYNITNLPFNEFYQNYRANLCHVTQLIILLVTNYHRSMKYNQKVEIKARIYTCAKLQLVMIVICVVVSGVCLGYEIYLLIKGKNKMQKVSKVKDESLQNATIEQINGGIQG